MALRAPARWSRGRGSAALVAGVGTLLACTASATSGCGPCRIDYDPPATADERAAARVADRLVVTVLAGDQRQACALFDPAARASVRAWQERFRLDWIRCGERAFFHPERSGLTAGDRAAAVTIDRGRAEVLIRRTAQSARRLGLVQRGGSWYIETIDGVDCRVH